MLVYLFCTCQHQSRIGIVQFVNTFLDVAVVSVALGVPKGVVHFYFIIAIFHIHFEVRNPSFFYAVPFGSFLAGYTVFVIVSIRVTEVAEQTSVFVLEDSLCGLSSPVISSFFMYWVGLLALAEKFITLAITTTIITTALEIKFVFIIVIFLLLLLLIFERKSLSTAFDYI